MHNDQMLFWATNKIGDSIQHLFALSSSALNSIVGFQFLSCLVWKLLSSACKTFCGISRHHTHTLECSLAGNNKCLADSMQKLLFWIFTWPGGAPLSNLIGLYLVDTLSRGEWADGRMETAARAIVTRAIAAMKRRWLEMFCSCYNIQMSHWRHTMLDDAEFWISCQQLRILSKASHWQLTKNSAPSTIVWRQCDIRIDLGQSYSTVNK